jgi:hypothetical protein
MDSDKSPVEPSDGNNLLKSAIVTVLLTLCSTPLLLLFLNALSGPMGFGLIIAPMIILQLPLVWILIRFKLLPQVEFGRPSNSAKSPRDNSVESKSEASNPDI